MVNCGTLHTDRSIVDHAPDASAARPGHHVPVESQYKETCLMTYNALMDIIEEREDNIWCRATCSRLVILHVSVSAQTSSRLVGAATH